MSDTSRMRSFWDRRARENALYFVDNNLAYRRPDPASFWSGGERALATLLEALGVELQADHEVVEIGCGVGRLTRAIAARARSVRALDVSADMLEQGRVLNPELQNVEWVQGDGRTLSGIETASADCCISHVVFQHIPDPAVTLGYVGEMGRVLRPGGWSAFQVSNDPRVHRPKAGLGLRRRVLGALGRAPRGQDHPAWLGSAVDLDDLAPVARRAGLDVERVVGRGTQFCLVLLRR